MFSLYFPKLWYSQTVTIVRFHCVSSHYDHCKVSLCILKLWPFTVPLYVLTLWPLYGSIVCPQTPLIIWFGLVSCIVYLLLCLQVGEVVLIWCYQHPQHGRHHVDESKCLDRKMRSKERSAQVNCYHFVLYIVTHRLFFDDRFLIFLFYFTFLLQPLRVHCVKR